jgi:hypothetical protein
VVVGVSRTRSVPPLTGTRIELVGMFELSDATNPFQETISVPLTGVPSARNIWSWIVVSGGAACAGLTPAQINAANTSPALATVVFIAPRFACRPAAPGPLTKITAGRRYGRSAAGTTTLPSFCW